MKQRLTGLLLVLALLLGGGLMLYPSFSDYWNSMHQSRAMAGYIRSLADADRAQIEQMMSAAQQYNRRLARSGQDFFLDGAALEEYYRTLCLGDTGIMGCIEIRSIGCRLPIYHGTDEAVLQVAVGHIPGTALPVGGQSTHCVLSGHRGLPSAKIFSDLDRLTEGDEFTICTLDEVMTYQVDQTRIVMPSDVSALAIEPGADLCTLVTCTPYGVNSHRLLVRGRRVAGRATVSIRVGADALMLDRTLTAPLFAAPMLPAGLIWLMADTGRRTRRRAVLRRLGR